MEFQCAEDEAWYDVKILRNGNKLTVKYVNFSEDFNETYYVEKFKSIEELIGFKKRFRPSSVQLQDQDCCKIVLGKTVCASYSFSNGEVKFFDAMVVEVLNEKHKISKEEEEECSCSYVLKWQDGPFEGQRTFARIGDICLTPATTRAGSQVDTSLESFLKIARERIEKIAGHDDEENNGSSINLETNSSYFDLEAYFRKLRRQRKNRFAIKTLEGRLTGQCKRIQPEHMNA